MIKYQMEFYSSYNRHNIDVLNYMQPISQSIIDVFPNILGLTMSRTSFTLCLPNVPSHGDLSKLGKTIASKDQFLDSCKKINKNGNNLFRKKH